MIAHLLSLLSALFWLLAGAPGSPPSAPAVSKFSIFHITSPFPNQVVTDHVDIIGSVSSLGLRYFFVEARRTFDDDAQWFPATLPQYHPVTDDLIGTFNTTSLTDSIFELRLVVMLGDGERSTLGFGPIFVNNSHKVIPTATPERRAVVKVKVEAPTPGQVVSGSVDFVGTVDAPDLHSFFIEFTLADGDREEWIPATLPQFAPVQSDLLGTWTTVTPKDGDYLLQVNVLAGAGPRQYFPIGVFKLRNNS